MIEAIVLAGGFGKRLQSRVQNIPKPMAPINNKPFLDYLFDYLIKNKVKRVILSVYYQYQIIPLFRQTADYRKKIFQDLALYFDRTKHPLERPYPV